MQPEATEGEVNYGIGKLTDGQNFIKIEGGWAFQKQKVSNQQDSVFLILKPVREDVFYFAPTQAQTRPDVSSHFNKPYLDSTGFHVTAFEDNVQKGIYKAGLYVRDAKTKKSSYIFLQNVKIGYPDFYEPESISKLPNLQEINHGFDFITLEKDFILTSGWAHIKGQDSKGSEISLVFQSKNNTYVSPTDMTLRPDVTAHFKNTFNFDDCGFKAKISKKKFKKGNYRVGFIIKNNITDKEILFFTEKIIVI